MQIRRNSSALAMELHLSCTNSSICGFDVIDIDIFIRAATVDCPIFSDAIVSDVGKIVQQHHKPSSDPCALFLGSTGKIYECDPCNRCITYGRYQVVQKDTCDFLLNFLRLSPLQNRKFPKQIMSHNLPLDLTKCNYLKMIISLQRKCIWIYLLHVGPMFVSPARC